MENAETSEILNFISENKIMSCWGTSIYEHFSYETMFKFYKEVYTAYKEELLSISCF